MIETFTERFSWDAHVSHKAIFKRKLEHDKRMYFASMFVQCEKKTKTDQLLTKGMEDAYKSGGPPQGGDGGDVSQLQLPHPLPKYILLS